MVRGVSLFWGAPSGLRSCFALGLIGWSAAEQRGPPSPEAGPLGCGEKDTHGALLTRPQAVPETSVSGGCRRRHETFPLDRFCLASSVTDYPPSPRHRAPS